MPDLLRPVFRTITIAPVIVFSLVFALLTLIRWQVTDPPMLLFDRLLPGVGWLEIFGLSLYGAIVVDKMQDPKTAQAMRLRIWTLFSLVFFGQLALGLTVSPVFLMSGELHIPVPAMILAGPVYRGEGLFMPILFLATVVLVGPAWCSHLCYFGAWDNVAARNVRRPRSLRQWAEPIRLTLLLAIIGVALLLRAVGGAPLLAGLIGLGFGIR